jgi:hypothetical protein
VSFTNRHLIATFALVIALACGAVAQQAPASGTYAVPSGWKLEAQESLVLLAAPKDEALVYLLIYRDNRESWQVVDDYADKVLKGHEKEVKIVSKDIFKRAGKDYARVTLTTHRKGGPTHRQNAFAIPIEGGTLLMVADAQEQKLAQYEPDITQVLNSVLPKEATAPQKPEPFLVERPTVGLKILVAASWIVEPESKGEYSGVTYMKITRDNALLSLSSKQDPRTPNDYLADVEKNTREQSKSYQKLSEQPQTIAGIQGTRLDVRTVNKQGIPVRRWIVLISTKGRHYVIAAGAPETSFDQYVADFNAMFASVVLMD